jgi:hypothetical protein
MRARLFALAVLLLITSGCITVRQPGPGTCPAGTNWDAAPNNCCRYIAPPAYCMEKSVAITALLFEYWQQLAVLVILMGFLLMGLVYMVAYAFDYKTVQIFVKNEMIQLAASAVILGSMLVFIPAMDSVSQQFAADILVLRGGAGSIQFQSATGEWTVMPGHAINITEPKMSSGHWTGRWTITELPAMASFSCPSPCHFYLARAYLGYNYERIAVIARSVVKAYATLSWIDYTRVGIFVNILGVVFQLKLTLMPFTGLSIIYHSLGTCFDFMAKAMVSLKFQEMTLMYIQNGVFPVFLIGGIIMRSVWFLRKLGGLLIAIAIGVYTLFPLLYILCWYTIDSSTPTMRIDATMVPAGNFRTSLLPWEAVNLGASDEEFEKMLFTTYDASNIPTPGILDIAASLMLPAVAVPLLNLIVTIAFIKTLSASLGGDMELAGLTRIL